MSDHRGRSRRHYYDDDDSYEYDEHRPRHRSLGRQALDKLEDAMGSLGLDSNSRALTPYQDHHHHSHHSNHHRPSSPHTHRESYYYEEDRPHHRRAYHSASPTRRHSHHRGRRKSTGYHHSSSSRSRSRWDRGLRAAVDAAAIEAFRLRNEPGPWKGPKGGRVATAAISAGVIGAATDHRRDGDGHKQKGALASAIGGLVVNRLVNGPRREVRS